MIIVSQDKTEIVNFDNIDTIWICSDEKGRYTIEATANTNATLGYYKTEERAKEVLQEIMRKYGEHAQIINPKTGIEGGYAIPKIYEMPKE